MATRQSIKKIGIAPEDGNPDDLLSPGAVAEWLGLTEQWLLKARARNLGPRFIKLAEKSIRYQRGDVQGWIDAKFKTARSRPSPVKSRYIKERVSKRPPQSPRSCSRVTTITRNTKRG
jgi:predicted DNA-binding transcriptional regulator AlpA